MAGLAARLYRCAIASHRRFAKQQGGGSGWPVRCYSQSGQAQTGCGTGARHGGERAQPRLFVQVNTGDEPQKAGVPVADVAGLSAIAAHSTGSA